MRKYTVVHIAHETGQEHFLFLQDDDHRLAPRVSFASNGIGKILYLETEIEAWSMRDKALQNGEIFRMPGEFFLRSIDERR